MTFDNEFLMVHYPAKGSDYLYKKKIVLLKDLEEVVLPYYASKVARFAYNSREDITVVQCGKYGRIEIYRK